MSADEETPLVSAKQHQSPVSHRKWSCSLAALAGVCCSLLLLFGTLPQSAKYLPSSLMLNSSSGARQIEICAKEMILVTPRPAVGATVHCWDKDVNSDDLMVVGKTEADGCARLTYEEGSWDGIGGRSPDIYCTVDKGGFVQAVPPDKDHHDQNTLAKFDDVTLYRDRLNDYGKDNGCGPEMTEGWGNDFASWSLRFKDQCTMHDKCYYDCQIFLALGSDAAKAEEFCDYEMYMGMKSECHANRGQLPGIGENGCLAKASFIYSILAGFYDKTTANCPFKENGERDESMENDYGHNNPCHSNGSKCGYDGTITDDKNNCNLCCEGPVAKDKGYVWNDHYCKCFPKDHRCGSTRIGNRYNDCNLCCSGQTSKDAGWFYTNYHCK